jgi:hypothetical protein
MPAIINKTDARKSKADTRKTVQDASDALAKAGTNGAAAGKKTAHDASEAGGETVRKDMAATSHDVIRKNAEAAEQTLQTAAKDLRDTMERSVKTVSDVAGAARQASGQSVEQLDRLSAMQDRAVKEIAGRTQQNLDVMIQTGVKLAAGFQAVMRAWADYTLNATQCNIDGMNTILRTRTMQELMTAQNNLLNAEMRVVLDGSVKITEATSNVAKDVARSIGKQMMQQRDQQNH